MASTDVTNRTQASFSFFILSDDLFELRLGVHISVSPRLAESGVKLSVVLFLFEVGSSGVLKSGDEE